jgi:hypothetical protein
VQGFKQERKGFTQNAQSDTQRSQRNCEAWEVSREDRMYTRSSRGLVQRRTRNKKIGILPAEGFMVLWEQLFHESHKGVRNVAQGTRSRQVKITASIDEEDRIV